MTTPFFRRYLEVAPFALSLWRSVEAQAIADVHLMLKPKLKRSQQAGDFPRPLLDLGCGFGEFSGVFFDRQVEVGIDISLEDLLRAKRGKKYRKLFVADARNLPFPQCSYATVLSVSVLEHIPRPQHAIREVFRILKRGGHFIYTVPTIEMNRFLFYPSLLEYLSLPSLKSWYLFHFHKAFKHVTMTTKSNWIRMTESAGFKLLSVKGMFPGRLVAAFDISLISALPSQVTRWLFGTRSIWGLPLKAPVLETLFNRLYTDRDITNSNIIVVAQKP